MPERGTIVVERLRGHLLNGSFTKALEEAGHWRVLTVDVVPRLRRHPLRLAAMALAGVATYGFSILRGHHPFRDAIFRTPTAMKLMRREVLEAIADLHLDEPFVTIQVQSMFDGHVPAIPHFVYTDHTHLANLRYPTFDSRRLFSPRWIECEREVYHHADRCFVRSPHVADSLVEDYGVDPSHVTFAYAGPNVRPGDTSPARPEDSMRLVFVGQDWERKGGPTLVEALRRVRRTFPDVTLSVIGCTPPVVPGMRALGRLPYDEVAKQLSDAAVFCLPTTVEPFGIAVIEAMAQGLPVVATKVGAIPDIVEDGVNAALVQPGDVDALASALTWFLGSPDRRAQAGQRSRELVTERYTWDAVLARMEPHLDPALLVGGAR